MFCDEAKITVIAGNGGNGAVSFHREKFVPNGGPDGGDGGKGGDLIFEAVENINTLSDFRTVKKFKAKDGESGSKSDRFGAAAEDLVLNVPVGTIVWNSDKTSVIADLSKLGDKFVMARGGKGGHGNRNFASSIRQAPEFAELGEPGEQRDIVLELKLVADVGIIGIPSAGKSTLISVISNSRPKIADYPFTTLIPNLGVVDLKTFGGGKSESFVVVDVPGLIEGAAEGKGLGHEFLKHVSRAGFLVHLLDISLDDVLENYKTINAELKKYSKDLAKKEQVVVLNKIDLVDSEFVDFIKTELVKVNPKLKGKILAISAATNNGIKDLVFELWKRVKNYRAKNLELRAEKENKENIKTDELEYKVYRPRHEDDKTSFEIELIGEEKIKVKDYNDIFEENIEEKTRATKKQRMARKELRAKNLELRKNATQEDEDFRDELEVPTEKIIKIFEVKSKRLEQIVRMTEFSNTQALDRVYDILKKMKIRNALIRKGAVKGDKLIIAGKIMRMK